MGRHHRVYICVIRIPWYKERENEAEKKIFKGVLVNLFPNLVKNANVKEAKNLPNV